MRKGGADPANVAGSPIARPGHDAGAGSSVGGKSHPPLQSSLVKTLAPPPPLAAFTQRSGHTVPPKLPDVARSRPPASSESARHVETPKRAASEPVASSESARHVETPKRAVSEPVAEPVASWLPAPPPRRAKGLIVAFTLGAATAGLAALGLVGLNRTAPDSRVLSSAPRQDLVPRQLAAAPSVAQSPRAELDEGPAAALGGQGDRPPSAEPAPNEAAGSALARNPTQRAARSSSRHSRAEQPRPAAGEGPHQPDVEPDQTEASTPASSEPAPRTEAAPSIVRLPEHPTRDQIKSALDATRPALTACIAPAHGTTFANVTIVSSGRVSYASIEGAFAGTPQGSCMARVLRSASFPRFTAASMKVHFPFVL